MVQIVCRVRIRRTELRIGRIEGRERSLVPVRIVNNRRACGRRIGVGDVELRIDHFIVQIVAESVSKIAIALRPLPIIGQRFVTIVECARVCAGKRVADVRRAIERIIGVAGAR